MGHSKLREKVESIINKEERPETDTSKVLSNSGRHIFTWRKDNNRNPSIHFPKDIIELITVGKLDLERLTNKIKESIENELSSL